MKFVKILVLALIFIVFIALVIQNQGVFTEKFDLALDLNFYKSGPYLVSNLVLIGAAFLIGVLFSVIWGAFYAVGMRAEVKEKDRRIKELEEELERRDEGATSPPPASSPFRSGSDQATE